MKKKTGYTFDIISGKIIEIQLNPKTPMGSDGSARGWSG